MRSMIFAGVVQLALGSLALGTEQVPEPWAAEPLGPKIDPTPFVPVLIKRELHPMLKVRPAKPVRGASTVSFVSPFQSRDAVLTSQANTGVNHHQCQLVDSQLRPGGVGR